MRRLAPLLVTLFLIPSATSACEIVNATAAYWPLAERSEAMTPEAQVTAFRADVVAKFPELYTDDALGDGNIRNLDKLTVAWLAITRKNGLKGRGVEQDLMEKLPAFLANFQKTFPDFRCDFPIYLMASLGSLDGAGRIVAGHPALVIGIDTMAAIETPSQLSVLIAHELFHRYNFQAAGFSDDPGDKQAIWRTLWAEGLATHVSSQLNPDAPLADVLISGDLAKRGPPLIAKLAAGLRDNDTTNGPLYAEYFEGGSAKAKAEGIPSRSGYYVGYRVVQILARQYTLYQLAHLSGDPLHAEINHALAELAAGAQ